MLLFRESERSTYLIGHVGQQLSRMRLLLREELARVSAEGETIEHSLPVLDAALRSSLAELEPLLSSSEVQLWGTWSRPSCGSGPISRPPRRRWSKRKRSAPARSWSTSCPTLRASWTVWRR